ncbi:MliC family protein [Bradyrhizobium sp. HKCCYLS2038]|uniref:MliC family protein n=1 Tax=unclassified Bradyrhizobium TaxID=2631580 RepID=UPI003EBC42DA
MKSILSAALLTVAATVALQPRANAQAVSSYRCADGTRFIVGFYPQDSRAFVLIDGGEVTLARRFAVSGRRYSGAGVTLTQSRDGQTMIRHARRPATSCEQS